MAVRGKPTVKNPYGDDKGFGVPTARKKASAGNGTRVLHKSPKTKHYVTLVMDELGGLRVDSSVAMAAYATQILTGDISERFSEACHRIETGISSDVPLVKPGSLDLSSTGGKRTSKKRRKSEQESSHVYEEVRSLKTPPSHYRKTGKMISITVNDRKAILDYFDTCLRAFQQINCRLICKLWIKLIHPKKQVTNPYNGTMKGLVDQKFPEKTKPSWWAPDVRHKEPDHLKRWERIKLMVHIIDYCVRENSDVPEKITIDDLFGEAEKKMHELHGGPSGDKMGRLQLIRDICHLRTMQKRYEDNEIDGDAICEVESHEEHARKAEREEASNEAKIEAENTTSERRGSKVQCNFDDVVVTQEPPMLTPASSTTTSPSVYQHQYGIGEPQIPQSAPQFPSTLTPYSPQSMTSFQSASGTSPFHDMHMHQHAMVLANQHNFNSSSMDHNQEHLAALNGAFVPTGRADTVPSWPSHINSGTNNYEHHMTSYGNEADHATPMHGLPLGQVGYMYDQTQDDSAAMGCFQGVTQLDPRHLGFYRGLQ